MLNITIVLVEHPITWSLKLMYCLLFLVWMGIVGQTWGRWWWPDGHLMVTRRGGAPNFLRRKGACSLYIHSIYSITEVLQLGKKIQVLCSAYIDRRFFVVDRRFLMYTLCIVLYILLYIHTVHGKVFVDGTLKSVHRPGYYILKSVCRRGIKKQKSACRWKIEKRLPM